MSKDVDWYDYLVKGKGSRLPWYSRVPWVEVVTMAIIAIGILGVFWSVTESPPDPCGARCADARP